MGSRRPADLAPAVAVRSTKKRRAPIMNDRSRFVRLQRYQALLGRPSSRGSYHKRDPELIVALSPGRDGMGRSGVITTTRANPKQHNQGLVLCTLEPAIPSSILTREPLLSYQKSSQSSLPFGYSFLLSPSLPTLAASLCLRSKSAQGKISGKKETSFCAPTPTPETAQARINTRFHRPTRDCSSGNRDQGSSLRRSQQDDRDDL